MVGIKDADELCRAVGIVEGTGVGFRTSLSMPTVALLLVAHMTQSAVKSHNGPADRLQSVGGACR